jgi:hypothetical protein
MEMTRGSRVLFRFDSVHRFGVLDSCFLTESEIPNGNRYDHHNRCFLLVAEINPKNSFFSVWDKSVDLPEGFYPVGWRSHCRSGLANVYFT